MGNNELKRKDKFTMRFLSLKDPFYDYIENKNVSPSDAIRHFIKQGINEKSGMSIENQEKLLNELIQLKKEHSYIGNNINQISRYFNTHEHLIENDLYKNLKAVSDNQLLITNLLNKIFRGL